MNSLPIFSDDRPYTIVDKTIGSYRWTNEERGWWVTTDCGGWGPFSVLLVCGTSTDPRN
jgi:hypothetical protein